MTYRWHDIWPFLLIRLIYESVWAQFAKTSQLQTPCALLLHIDWQAFNITVNSCFSVLPAGKHCRPHILKCCDFNQALVHFHSTKIILFDCWIWNQTHEGLLKLLGWRFHLNQLPTHNKNVFQFQDLTMIDHFMWNIIQKESCNTTLDHVCKETEL